MLQTVSEDGRLNALAEFPPSHISSPWGQRYRRWMPSCAVLTTTASRRTACNTVRTTCVPSVPRSALRMASRAMHTAQFASLPLPTTPVANRENDVQLPRGVDLQEDPRFFETSLSVRHGCHFAGDGSDLIALSALKTFMQ